MPLPKTEAFVFDYIKYNPDIRDFWDTRVKELNVQGLDDSVAAEKLAEILVHVYTSKEALDDLLGLVDQVDLMTMDWNLLALMLLGRDIEKEIRDTESELLKSSPTNIATGRHGTFLDIFPSSKIEDECLGERHAAFENAEKEYYNSIKVAKTAKLWAIVPSLILGYSLSSYFWQQTSNELTVSAFLMIALFACICACFIWPFLALIIQMCEPKQKPDFLYYLSCSIDKIRKR